jgi:outer membrane protein
MTRRAHQRSLPGLAHIAGLIVLAASASAPRPASAESLGDAIALAYQTNPTLLAARADLRALDERYIQARAAFGPTLGVSEQHAYSAAGIDQGASIFGPKSTSYGQGQTDSAQLTLNQPLYTGGQLSAAVTAAQAQVLGGRQSLRQQEQTILGQVITAYADVLVAQQLVTIAGQNVDILRRQLDETQAKVDVKANTLTDRAQARARLGAAQINLIQAREGLDNAAARYQSVIGQRPGQLEALPDLPGIPPDVDTAFDAAERSNPEVQVAVYAELASRAQLAEAKAADGLSVGLSASVGTQPEFVDTPNLNIRSATVAVVVTKPLFTAGAHTSRVRQAREINDRDDLTLDAARRNMVFAVGQAWTDLASRRDQITGLNDQLEEEEIAFHGSQIEERIGIRTTIDVLNAEQELQSTKVALAQAYRDEYLARVTLLTSMGLLQAELLAPDIEPYRPEDTFNRRDLLNRALAWEGLVASIDGLAAPHMAKARSARDPLGEGRPTTTFALPKAPQWSDLTVSLREDAAVGDSPGVKEAP